MNEESDFVREVRAEYIRALESDVLIADWARRYGVDLIIRLAAAEQREAPLLPLPLDAEPLS